MSGATAGVLLDLTNHIGGHEPLPEFKHTPLDHSKPSIRLIKVLPDLSPSGLVQCALSTHQNNPPYTCLSYVWGSATSRRQILLDGKLFCAQQNLWNFLNSARSFGDPAEFFWIDAVCIDQTNTPERNHQVAHMGMIYRSASQVMIWLGTRESTSRFLTTTRELHCEVARSGDPNSMERIRSAWDDFQVADVDQFSDDCVQFATDVYWTRAWITQEVILASKIWICTDKCGVRTKHLMALYFLAFLTPNKYFDRERRMRGAGANANKYITNTVWRDGRRYSMMDLLANYPNRVSHASRDKVYSLTHMATDGGSIPINYDLTDTEFFHDLIDALAASIHCLCDYRLLAHTLKFSPSHADDDDGPTFDFVIDYSVGYSIIPGDKSGNIPKSTRRSEYVTDETFCSECDEKLIECDYFLCLKTSCSRMKGHLFLRPCYGDALNHGWLWVRDITSSHATLVGMTPFVVSRSERIMVTMNCDQLTRLTTVAYYNRDDPYHSRCPLVAALTVNQVWCPASLKRSESWKTRRHGIVSPIHQT